MGIFGTRADTIFEVNLLVQLVLIIILVIGVYQRRPLKRHGTIMALATLLNFGTTALIMLPSLISNWHVIVTNPFNLGVGITLAHSIGGSLALALGILFSVRFFIATRNSRPLKCGVRRVMISTFIMWIAALGGGVAFYLYYYS
ncbi:MAG: hypothetical protein ACW98U_13065 [Candidatus Thorarchaeota archaeon]